MGYILFTMDRRSLHLLKYLWTQHRVISSSVEPVVSGCSLPFPLSREYWTAWCFFWIYLIESEHSQEGLKPCSSSYLLKPPELLFLNQVILNDPQSFSFALMIDWPKGVIPSTWSTFLSWEHFRQLWSLRGFSIHEKRKHWSWKVMNCMIFTGHIILTLIRPLSVAYIDIGCWNETWLP